MGLDLVEGMAEGRFGVILKVHHSLADGLGLMEMTAAMVRRVPTSSVVSTRRGGLRAPRRVPPAWLRPVSVSGSARHAGR